jgi:hypothetical protein
MRIAFLVGSMNTKTNGVAAYTKLLSEQLKAIGHTVTTITLNEEKSKSASKDIYTIEKSSSTLKRFLLLDSTLKKLNPDIISIQFVPYSFHKKGLSFELLIFSQILKKFNVHLMIHEPWIEITNRTNTKNKIVSSFQRAILSRTISIIKPTLITSTIPHYVKMIGRNSKLLSLFGNIPYQPKLYSDPKNEKELKCIFFGTFSLDTNSFVLQLNWIKQHCLENNLTPKITLVGDNGNQKANNIKLINTIIGEDNLLDLGWLGEKEISHLFQTQDLGISRATLKQYGKSGSTMAMLEHGLPVLLRGTEDLKVENLANFDYEKQLIQTSESHNFKMCRFEPKIDAVNVHTQKFLTLVHESLLLS